jgi:hypothetical protein
MKRSLKIAIWVVVSIVILDVAISSALSYYDSQTRKNLLQIAGQELSPGASDSDMVNFMQRHTARYARDDQFRHEYSGFLPQSRLDHMLFDRKVQVILRMNGVSRFDSAQVQVYYTGL